MKASSTFEISDILETFDKTEINSLIDNQLYTDHYSMDKITDHLMPLYVRWRSIMENTEVVEEIKLSTQSHFIELCEYILKNILKRFNMAIDDDWIELNQDDIPALTLAVYHYFVLNFTSNLYEVIMNYVMTNNKLIYDIFEEMENKKDASTINQKKKLSPKMAMIIANIYDISEWIIHQIDEENFFKYTNKDYALNDVIIDYINKGVISGDFMNEIIKIYLTNISLKSEICFTIISNAKIGNMADPFKN